VFPWLARTGNVPPDEMLRVFNCGIGMALVVSNVASASALLSELGESFTLIGRIEAAPSPDAAASLRFSHMPAF
jgi:phosphoribosylformylglycinamidine cyclo-ligase